MPKLKSVKSMRKRYKLSGTGKVLHRKMAKGHLLQHRTRKAKRALKKWTALDNPKLAKKIAPYII